MNSCFKRDTKIEDIFNTYKLRKLVLLKSLCQKNGVQILLREYNFYCKHKETFNEEDILNFFPIAKHSPTKVILFNFKFLIVKLFFYN